MLTSHVNLQNVISLYNLSQTGAQMRAVVAPNAVMFSNFSFIYGIASTDAFADDSGPPPLSISQLHIINSLIQRLYQLHEEQGQAKEALEEKLQQIAKSGAPAEKLLEQLQKLERELLSVSYIDTVDIQDLQAEAGQHMVGQTPDINSLKRDTIHDQGSIFDISI